MTAQEFLNFWQSTGLTQKQLANVLGCSQSAISEWKDGKRTIPKKTLTSIRLMQENQALREQMKAVEQSFAADKKGAPREVAN